MIIASRIRKLSAQMKAATLAAMNAANGKRQALADDGAPQTGSAATFPSGWRRDAYVLPVRLDGEPVVSTAFAMMLPWHLEPWEVVVEQYLAAREEELRRTAPERDASSPHTDAPLPAAA